MDTRGIFAIHLVKMGVYKVEIKQETSFFFFFRTKQGNLMIYHLDDKITQPVRKVGGDW